MANVVSLWIATKKVVIVFFISRKAFYVSYPMFTCELQVILFDAFEWLCRFG